jgi:diguanylate cyclase (GGDEF)-like protein
MPEIMLTRASQLLALSYERDQFTNRLRHAAYVDALTGVLSRAKVFGELERMLVTTEVTVLFIDLDGFKQVNDRFGHAAGDNLLRAAAERIRSAMRPGDLVGRIGGDEFVVVCGGSLASFESGDIASRLVEAFRQPVSVSGVSQEITVSVGVASAPQLSSPSEVVNRADAAMYRAKQSGRNRWSR